MIAWIIPLAVVVFVLVTLWRTVRIIPQARAGVVERFGRYSRTLTPGLAIVVPFVDRVRPLLDLREQVVSFEPQPVITEDNLVVNIDTVLYFQVTDAKAATYEIANYIQGIEQLTVTTLRNVIGGIALEKTLTSRDHINTQLRSVLDDATGKWGIRVNRVELKAIDPPASIQDSMEKQMRADREKRAVVLAAEGERQSAILKAEGERQAAILRAQGQREATMLQAEGQAKAIETVFGAIHEGKPDAELLAYQYLQMLPQIAQGESNKLWIIPSDLQQAVGKVAGAVKDIAASSAAGRDRRAEARSRLWPPWPRRRQRWRTNGGSSSDAAVRVFARKGFHASRVGDIAEEAGVAHGLLYHYFKSKDKVLEAVFHENWSILIARIESVEETDEPAADQIRHIAAIVLRTWLHLPDVVRVVIQEFGRSPELAERIGELTLPIDALQRVIARGIERGEFRKDIDPAFAATVVYGSIDELLTAWVLGRLPSDEEAVARAEQTLVEVILLGLKDS